MESWCRKRAAPKWQRTSRVKFPDKHPVLQTAFTSRETPADSAPASPAPPSYTKRPFPAASRCHASAWWLLPTSQKQPTGPALPAPQGERGWRGAEGSLGSPQRDFLQFGVLGGGGGRPLASAPSPPFLSLGPSPPAGRRSRTSLRN